MEAVDEALRSVCLNKEDAIVDMKLNETGSVTVSRA